MNASQSPSCEFNEVELGSFLENACSPKFATRTAVGVLIRTPDRVTAPLSGEARWPLCITAQLTAAEVERYRHVFHPAQIVLVDDDRGETITGSLWKDRTFREPEPLAMTDEEKKIITITSFYNVNVFERINLPRRKAKYHAYVTLNAHKSNVCAIEVDVK